MQIFNKTQIEAVLSRDLLTDAVANAFVAFSKGRVTIPPVGYLPFTEPSGDMHIKYGHIKGDPVFVVKLATGFYDNPKLGLPSSNGLMLVLSAETGVPLALLQDEGFLTDSRTAAAGAIASKALAPQGAKHIGIVGTGIQARMQLMYHRSLMPIAKVSVFGRNTDAAALFAKDMQQKGIDVCQLDSIEELCANANIIITTTPATSPLIMSSWVNGGTHITAVGADAPGKQEIDNNIFERVAFTVFDSKEQCLHHGETCHASVVFDDRNSAELGALIDNPALYKRADQDITVADLTGIAAQDIAAAKIVWNALKSG
ncbi:Rossmann-fold NAD(P)-binding domain-containing protein [Kordiimonas aquimaris]|uniref:hypothetical protein n=1 Tax=Kordiimonas aquimaris TaxID=707591 RepID=UPI0021D1FD92|nr:hypothetical protein [Kordiimonas aquimaris]